MSRKMSLPQAKSYVDMRKLLEDKTSTRSPSLRPNHVAFPMANLGCRQDKDIYVEKPCSHNTFEGRQLVRAVKIQSICQHGSQWRSNPACSKQ